MVYTTKFHKIGMFNRFLAFRFGVWGMYRKVGRNLYQSGTVPTTVRISSGENVRQVVDEYMWHT